MNGTKTTIWLYILIAFAVFSAVPDIHAATPSATPIADVAQNEADTINLDVAGSFSDGDGHTLTFTATGLPEGIGISSAGLISGKLPKVTANTSYGVTVTATDPGNLTADQSFALTVINSINELPVLARNTVLRINQDAAAGTIGNNYLQLTDENNPGAGSLTYTLTAVPVKGTCKRELSPRCRRHLYPGGHRRRFHQLRSFGERQRRRRFFLYLHGRLRGNTGTSGFHHHHRR